MEHNNFENAIISPGIGFSIECKACGFFAKDNLSPKMKRALQQIDENYKRTERAQKLWNFERLRIIELFKEHDCDKIRNNEELGT